MIKQFTVTFLLITTVISAQFKVGDIELEFSKAIPNDKGNIMHIAGVVNDSVYAISRTKKEFFFQTFNAKTKSLTSSKPFEIQRNQEIRDYVIIGEKLFLMLTYYNELTRNYHFIVKEIKNNVIIKAKEIFSFTAEERSRKGEFLFKRSHDGLQYLVTHVHKNYRNPALGYTMILFDENLTEVFTDKKNITSEEKRIWTFKFSDTKFNENGDIVFAIIESYRDKSEKNKYNNVTIYSYLANNNFNRKEIKIELQDNYLADCTVIPTKDDRLHVVGFYSTLKKSGRRQWHYEGIYDMVINYHNGEIIKKNFIPFPDFVYDLFTRSQAKKEKGLYYTLFKNIAFIERDTGGIIVLTEYDAKGDPGTFGVWPLAWTSYSFDSEHVIVTALNPDGTLHWNDFIPKIQWMSIEIFGIMLIPPPNYTQPASMTFPLVEMGTGEEYISVFPIYKNGKLTVLYNDHHKTTDYDTRILEGLNRMETVAYIFDDETGEGKRVKPDQFQKGQINLKPLINHKISNNRYLIYGGNKTTNALGELKIKK